MTNFNSNLNSLFKNFKQQNIYSKYAKASEKDKKNKNLWSSIDINNDGKINSTDKSKIDSNKNKLLKKENLFDVNGDGKLNQKDIDMFIKGDVNGDGKVSSEEKAFIEKYKEDLINTLSSAKATFKIDGKQYVKGKLAEGLYDGKYYKNGFLYTGAVSEGKENSITYKDGVKESIIKYQYVGNQKVSAEKEFFDASGNVTKKKTYIYENGKGVENSVITYKYNLNNQLISSANYDYNKDGIAVKYATNEYSYKNDGEPDSITTTVVDSTGKILAKAVNTYLINNNVDPYMSATPEGIVINFKGKQLLLNEGQTANITTDGNHVVEITDGTNSAIYKADGEVKSKSPKTYIPVEPQTANSNNKKTENIYDASNKVTGKIIREYDSKGKKVLKTTIIEYQPGTTTKKFQKVIYDNGEIDEITFNKNGKKLTVKKTNSYGAYMTSAYTYEPDGETVKYEKRKDYTANNIQRTDIKITYKNGKKLNQERYVYNPTTKGKNRYCTYEYNDSGKKTKEIVIRYDRNLKKTESTIYSYEDKKVTIINKDANDKVTTKRITDDGSKQITVEGYATKGNENYIVTSKKTSGYPKITKIKQESSIIKFKNGKIITVKTGQKAVINSDGTVYFYNDKNSKKYVTYNEKGNKI